MSQWSHINGNIRVDSLCGLLPDETPKFNEIFKTCNFEDEEEKWNNCNVPCGSEGSVQVSIYQNPDPSCLSQYSISIYGDLRDYSNKDEVKQWFEEICTKKDLIIRNAELTCEVEYDAIYIFVFYNKKVYEFKAKREETE